ncbi:MAG: L,D-transpeptidase family protein [bacterium]
MIKKTFTVLLFPTIFIAGCFYFASFFIPKITVIESSPKSYAGFLSSSPMLAEFKQPSYLGGFADIKKGLLKAEADFLEVNLPQMKVIVWAKGKEIKQVPILKIGDAESWGGTAAGLYEILAKYKIAWSGISEVNMPYALHFYGKYYIHGEPYYANGQKLVSDVSGGCIRLKNEDAKEIYDLVAKKMPVLVIDKEYDKYEYPAGKINQLPSITAQSFLAVDIDSGFVFGEKNSAEKYSIASLTKLMTSVVVAENISLNKFITITPSMLEAYGTNEKLIIGERFRVVELLYPFLIESCNDAGEALAGYMGREETIKEMNEKAKAIFMKNTIFACPTGFDPANVSTAQDLFRLTEYIFNNRPPIFEITRGKKVPSFGGTCFIDEELWNKNIFSADSSFIGGKTGYLPEIKNNGIFVFRFLTDTGNKRNIVIIILGSENAKADTQKIYKWLETNYSLSPAY